MWPHCASHFIFLAEKNHKRRRASSIIIGKTLPCSISNRQYVLITPFLLRWSTFVQAVDSWLLDHVIYLKKITVVKAEKILKMAIIFTQNCNFWMNTIVILWICSGLTKVTFFSAWDKSRDPRANNQLLEQM